LRLRGKINKACVQSVLMHSSETWAMKVNKLIEKIELNMRRQERAGNTTLKWMCGVTLRDKKRAAELMNFLGVVSVEEVVTHGHGRVCGG